MNAPSTAALHRVMNLANHIARSEKSGDERPEFLLYALSQHESRATIVLQTYGIDLEAIVRHFCMSPSTFPTEQTYEIAQHDVWKNFERYRDEAGQLMAGDSSTPEIGSEHLLAALVTIDSPVAAFLHEHGLTRDALAEQLPDVFPAEPVPLAIDFEIQWPSSGDHARSETLRAIDAAANRAREGLRVVEDYVRMALDDAHLTALLKEFRHGLTTVLRRIPNHDLLAARETELDVGTAISTTAERERESPIALLTANFKRVQEALRTLEEFGKLLDVEFAQAIEQLRYRSYTLEKAVGQTVECRERFDGRDLYLLATTDLCDGDVETVVRQAVLGGVRVVQLREKSLADREVVVLGKRLRKLTQELGALFIMNDRADLAVATNADGVHVGQEELSVHDVRRVVGPNRLVGVSTHSIEQARQAVIDGADYIGVGPVFSSQTKSFDELAGLDFVRQVAEEITLPWFAIGGIDKTNVDQLIAAGATRVAVSGAICRADNPQTVARELCERLRVSTP